MNNNETLKALYKTLKATQKRLYEIENASRKPVAVIGMACRFPGGASNIEKYRALLESGGDAICEVPQDRWDGQMYYDPDPAVPGKVTTNLAGFLQEPIDGFDCAFFHLSPKEVQSMDPQQRMLLEVCWEAFENAGIDIAKLKGSKTGVFCGIANSDYAVAHLRSGYPEKIDAYSVTGTALSAAVGRISYLFGFEGPNMALDTACSSSLVAVHLACQSLRSGESDIAVAAGINLILTPEGHIGFSKLSALSPDGRCKSFDDSADGYGRGEGCGLIVLKRLSDAMKNGDPVRAVVRGTAVNQDGRTNGFTAPSGLSQEKVLRKALEDSDLRPEDIGYIEAHGTGTPLGDPIEMEAIGKVYSPGRDVSEKPVTSPLDPRPGSLYVGSVKANIGHLEAAAGIAGFIKAVLMLDYGSIFPQMHFATPSRHILWSTLPVKIPLELMSWPRGSAPRGVAVSAFGFSGTNANMILQEGPLSDPDIGRGESCIRPVESANTIFAPTCPMQVCERSHHILNISANDREGLRDLALLYHGYLSDTNIRSNKDIDAGRTGVRRSQEEIGDICYTASVGRGHFPHRLSVVGRTKEELRDVLGKTHENALCCDGQKDILVVRDKRIIFLFTGQGSQYHKMGWDLYQTHPVFRSVMDNCDELLSPHLDRSLTNLLYEGDTSSLHETRYTQPVIFAVEYALAKLLESWGIKPSLVIGHSIGEYVAATIAGIFELKDVLGLVAARGRLVQSLPMNGSMAAVMAGEQRVKEAIDACRGDVSIAAMNAPRNTVISGEKEAIDRIIAQLRKDGVASHILKVSHAFHSCLLDPILEEFSTLAASIRYSTPNLPIMANTTGGLGGAEMATSDYWTMHLREPVRFYDSMRAIGDISTDYGPEYPLAIEVGGTSTLTSLGRQCIPDHEGLWLTTLGSMDNPGPGRIEGHSDWEPMLKCLAGLYTAGCDIDWEGFDRPYPRKKVVLPNYPFQRKRCWIELPGPREKRPVLAVPLAVPCNLTINRGYKDMISQNDNFTDINSIYAGTVYDQLNRMGGFYILRAFKETGVLRGSEEQYQVQTLKEKMGVIPEYGKLFDVLLIILKNAGFISLSDTMVTALGPVNEWDIQEITRAADNLQHKIVSDYPEMAATVNSLAKCMDKYSAVLTGRMNHAEALFPNGSMELVENLYTNNRIQDFFNRLVGQKVGECVTQISTEDSAQRMLTAPSSPEIKILEIGAGTGSTTGHVLREISGLGNFAYCYTDIASVFTQHGKRKFGASYPFMTFKTLDIEEDVESQGFDVAFYDVIIASNVLHATARIDRTLSQVRKLLKPGGVLIMNEVTKFQEIVSVIFGLTSGWWLFQDPERRIANCPSLSFAGWKTGLEEAGFTHLEHSGLPGDAEDHPMQCVIIAKSELNSQQQQPGRRERIASEVMGLMYQSSEIEITGYDGDTNLFELGFASLMIARLKDLIKRMYGLDVQMSWFYSRLDTFNKTVDYIDKESEADKVQESVSDIDGRIPFSNPSAPDSQSCSGEATVVPRAVRIEDGVKGAHSPADGIISQQIELMSRQLAVMSEQLHVLRGAGKGTLQELQNDKREPLTVDRSPFTVNGQRSTALDIEAGRTGVRRSRQELHACQASLTQDQRTDAGVGVGVGVGAAPRTRPEISTAGGGKTTAGGRGSLPTDDSVKKRDEYVAYRGVTGREKLELNTRQKEHLQRLIGRYTKLTAGSKERTRKYRPVFANTRNIAGFRPEWKEMIYQIIVERAEGSHFTDIDGRDYLDISMGFGVYLLGHNPPFVQAALQREIQRGTPIGPMSDRAGKVATLIHELTGVERVAFFNTGTEAVMAAVRIARTVTGRKKIALFSSAYHGHFDGVLAVKDFDGPVGSAAPMSPGTPPGLVQDIYVLDYGTEESLQFIEVHGRELAAVLVEPVQSRRPDFQPTAFLKRLREITTALGAALIFDEVILGFRIHPGGAQAWFDIKADIVTYGKVVGGGMPIGVVAGKSHYMDAVDGGMWNYGDGSFPEKENTFIAGTFNHHPLAMASAYAALAHLKESGPSLQANLNLRTGELAERLNSYFAGEGLSIRMIHFGSLFRIPVKGDQELLYYHLLSRGIYIWEGRNCFLSTAHTDDDIGYFVKSVQESIEEMRAGGLFKGGIAPLTVDHSPLKSDGTSCDTVSGQSSCSRRSCVGYKSFGWSKVNDFYPLSSAQNRMFILSQTEGGELGYHIPVALFIDGQLDYAKVEKILGELLQEHEILRTGFVMEEGRVVQKVQHYVNFHVMRRVIQESAVEETIRDIIQPFDLSQPPLLRVCLARINETRHLFVLDTHHIIFDGISANILISEFISRYSGQETSVPVAQYRDYVADEQHYFVGSDYCKHEAYWLEKFSTEVPLLFLPTDFARPSLKTFSGGKMFRKVDNDVFQALKRFARSARTSLHMTLFAAYFLLLHKLTGNEDVVVGATYNGRSEKFASSVGMFVNTLPVRCRPEGKKTFNSFLDEVKKVVLEAYDCQGYPFEHLVEKLALKREMSRNPLFDTMFVYETQASASIVSAGLTFTERPCGTGASAFDMILDVTDSGQELNISLDYSTDLFREETVQLFLKYYEYLLKNISDNAGKFIADIDGLPGDEKALRSYLGDKSPDFMIPSQFSMIGKMPITSNGMIDTKALSIEIEGDRSESCIRSLLKHDTAPKSINTGPQTENEELLVGLWKAVLGREEIGVLDNYFVLGGDSIKTIQILSRLNQQHLKLEVRHFFETPTIRDLAKKIETISNTPQQGMITGRVPLTAVQTWFFREHGGELDHYVQAVLLRSQDIVDERALRLSLLKLQEHHDSLRMIFRFDGESVVQEIAGLEYPLDFIVADLKGKKDAKVELDSICAEVSTSLHLNQGQLMKIVLFRLDDGDRILIVIHHLVVDGVSWRILIEDMGVCYEQAVAGRTLALPPKTCSYQLWAEKIAQYSTSPKLLEEVPFWRQIEETVALAIPPDFEVTTVDNAQNLPGPPHPSAANLPIVDGIASPLANRYEDVGTVFVELSHNETLALITKANSAYHTEVNDLLLAAFGRTMKRCYGAKRGFIDIRGHGRQPLFNDINIGRTVGWFTGIYPALIDIPESDEPGMQVKQIKEALRRIPNNGIGYGILKYIAPVAEKNRMRLNRARILFNYLDVTVHSPSQREGAGGRASVWHDGISPLPTSPRWGEGCFDADGENRFFIDERNAVNTIGGQFERENEIEGVIIGKRLKLSLSYNTKVHCKETVDMFLQAYRDELLAVIDHCISREVEELTPHDLTWKDLTVLELDSILSECGISNDNLKDIYPLSPLQEGMLFHAMLNEGQSNKRLNMTRDLKVKNLTPPPIASTAAYFMQTSFGIEGELNLAFFEACWNVLVARHDILRTVFIHKGSDRPLQVVTRKGSIDFRFEANISFGSDLSDAQQREYLAKFRNRDRDEGFDLMRKTPMRVSVFKKSERSFEVVWSHHHLLIDGWCVGILMSEFFEAYSVLRQGGIPEMKPEAPYSAYIRWIENLDIQSTINYWRDYLQGYDHPAVLPKKPSTDFRPEMLVLEIEPETVENLKRFAFGNQVTVNTVFQTAWALVLGRYSGADDVVFGATVSGRPAQVADIENMVGLFINTVPVRIRINPEKTVAQLVRDVQADALKSEPHHYGSLADVQAATSLKQELLDHVMVFENLPLADELIGLEQKYSLGFCIKDVKVFDQTNYDLIIVVEPAQKMWAEFRYNAAVFSGDLMERMKEALRTVISSIASCADISIGRLRLSLMSKAEQNERDSFIKSAQEISEDF